MWARGVGAADEISAAGTARGGPKTLLERASHGLAHEAKNPLHTMALHLHLLAEKVGRLANGDPGVEKHVTALRTGIGKVDALLKAFAELATPDHAEPDLAVAYERAVLLFGYELRRLGGQATPRKGPMTARVDVDGGPLGELVTHAFLAGITAARGGGTVQSEVRVEDSAAMLLVEVEGGLGTVEEVATHLEVVRSLSLELKAELLVGSPAAGSVRLSISLPRSR